MSPLPPGLGPLLVALLTALVATPLLRAVLGARLPGADPSEARRVHERPVPITGGVALAVSLLAGLAVAWGGLAARPWQVLGLVVGGAAVFTLGLLDDLRDTSPRSRLLAMVPIAAWTWACGFSIDRLGPWELGLWSAPATILWILIVWVGFNFIDGLDGLAAGLGLIATLPMAALLLFSGQLTAATFSLVLGGALAGLLVWNRPPARVFLGDSGAGLMGYLLAALSLRSSSGDALPAALLLAVPLLDFGTTLWRRLLLRQGLFLPERGHLHHRLLDRFGDVRRPVAVLWSLGILAALSHALPVFAILLLPAAGLLLAGTGYLRPRQLWLQGLRHRQREAHLVATCAELRHLQREGRYARLVGEDCVDCVRWPGGQVGPDGPEERGLRYAVRRPGGHVVFFWRGRDSGPSRKEREALQRLVDE